MNPLAPTFQSGGRHADSLQIIPTARTESYENTSYDGSNAARLGSSLEMLPSITEAVTDDTNEELKKAIEAAIHRCEHALKLSEDKIQQAEEDESAMFQSSKSMLDDFHGLTEKHQDLYGEREKLFKRLPSNQVVNVVHNALLEEHEKEDMCIADSFGAVKLAKANLREQRARQFERVKETHEREVCALEKQIASLRLIAELAGVALDRHDSDAQYGSLMDGGRESIWLPPSVSYTRSSTTPIKSRQAITISGLGETNHNHGMSKESSSHQKPKKSPECAKDETVKICDNCKHALSGKQEDGQTTSTNIACKTAVNPYPEHDTLWGWMGKFVQQGQYIVSQIQERYEDEVDAASSQYDREQKVIESGLRNRAEQQARVGKIRDVVGKLWETEKKNEKQWDAAWKMTNMEMKLIKKELEVFENRVPRCDDKFFTRRKAAETLLVKQKRFYEAILYRVETEAAGCGFDLEISE